MGDAVAHSLPSLMPVRCWLLPSVFGDHDVVAGWLPMLNEGRGFRKEKKATLVGS